MKYIAGFILGLIAAFAFTHLTDDQMPDDLNPILPRFNIDPATYNRELGATGTFDASVYFQRSRLSLSQNKTIRHFNRNDIADICIVNTWDAPDYRYAEMIVYVSLTDTARLALLEALKTHAMEEVAIRLYGVELTRFVVDPEKLETYVETRRDSIYPGDFEFVFPRDRLSEGLKFIYSYKGRDHIKPCDAGSSLDDIPYFKEKMDHLERFKTSSES